MPIEFADLEKLPDDVKYVLPDGREVTMGDLRAFSKTAAESTVNKRIADLTPREQKVATKEREIEAREEEIRKAMLALASAPAPAAAAAAAATPGEFIPLGYTPEQWAAVKNDPYSRPLVEALGWSASKIKDLEDRLNASDRSRNQEEAERRQQEEARWINYQLDRLATEDERYKDPAERQALLDFTKEALTRRDLKVIHRARHHEDLVKAAREEGYQKGLTEGAKKAPLPTVPYRTTPPAAVPALEKLPPTHSQFVDEAANDQDLIQEIREMARGTQ